MAYLLSATSHLYPDETFYISGFTAHDGLSWAFNFTIEQPLRFESFAEARKALNKVIICAIRDGWVHKYTIDLKKT